MTQKCKMGLGLLLVLSLAVVDSQFWGYNHYNNYGAQQGCMWGSQAVALPGQCHSFQCVSRWFGAAYAMQCPFGTIFSARESRCVSPASVAAQCPAASLSPLVQVCSRELGSSTTCDQM